MRRSVEWTLRAVAYAVDRGAAVISIIPVRGGNGEIERLQKRGHFAPPTLSQLEETLEGCLQFTRSVVIADLWDAERGQLRVAETPVDVRCFLDQ